MLYVNLDEKNNEISQNSLGGYLRELWGAAAPLNLFGTYGESFLNRHSDATMRASDLKCVSFFS